MNIANKNNKFYSLIEKNDVINLKENPANYYNFLYSHPMFKLEDLQKAFTCKLLQVSSFKQLEENNSFQERKRWLDDRPYHSPSQRR